MEESEKKLNGIPKAAVLLIALGKENAAEIFKNLDTHYVERLVIELAKLQNVRSDIIEKVVDEFYRQILSQETHAHGGEEYTKALLEKTYGPDRAKSMMNKVDAAVQPTGFERLRDIDPLQLINFVKHEHPQTIALVLTHLEKNVAAKVIAQLTEETQTEVAYRIATMGSISPEMLRSLEGILGDNVETFYGKESREVGGARSAAQILNSIGRSTEIKIMDDIGRRNPALASEIRNMMFTFEDIQKLDDGEIQKILKKIDSSVLALALKGTPEELREAFYRNLSERAAGMIREELEYMGKVPRTNVEQAQMSILEEIRSLEEEGTIATRQGPEDEYVD